MNGFLRISVFCTILLIASGDDDDGCNSPMTCLSSSACLQRHDGAGNLYNSIIFQCEETTSSEIEKVCCPPIRNVGPPRLKTTTTTPPREPTTKTTIRPEVKSAVITPLVSNVKLDTHKNYKLLPLDVCGSQFVDKIANGQNANLGQFPWMALLGYSDPYREGIIFKCGGTLITDRFVLTAAHCVDTAEETGIEMKRVRLGELDLTRDPDCVEEEYCAPDCVEKEYCAPNFQEYDVDKVTPHPDYNRGTLKNDIALVRLRTAVTQYSEYVRPICLPFGLDNITGAEKGKYTVAGWGKTDASDNHGSPVLKYTYLTTIPIQECNALQKNAGDRMLIETQLCAGGGAGEDSCKGDSGGPLTHLVLDVQGTPRIAQIGVVSYGFKNCGKQGVPSVYTRVFSYLRWILDNIST